MVRWGGRKARQHVSFAPRVPVANPLQGPVSQARARLEQMVMAREGRRPLREVLCGAHGLAGLLSQLNVPPGRRL